MKTIIIDDEEGGRNTLAWLLGKHCPKVKVVGQAEDVDEAVALIQQVQPELVFLDVELHSGTGFDVLERLPKKSFALILVTAYNEYAIKAFRYSALHYLLKPVDVDELQTAVNRAAKRIELNDSGADELNRIQAMLEHLRTERSRPNRIMLPIMNGVRMVSLSDIVRLQSDGNYTYFHLLNQPKLLVSRTMKEFEAAVDKRFFRIHRTHLINLDHMVTYVRGRSGYVEMVDGSQLAVSRYRKDELLAVLEVRE